MRPSLRSAGSRLGTGPWCGASCIMAGGCSRFHMGPDARIWGGGACGDVANDVFKAPRTQPRSSGRWSPHAYTRVLLGPTSNVYGVVVYTPRSRSVCLAQRKSVTSARSSATPRTPRPSPPPKRVLLRSTTRTKISVEDYMHIGGTGMGVLSGSVSARPVGRTVGRPASRVASSGRGDLPARRGEVRRRAWNGK